MIDPKDIITFPSGKFITTTTAARILKVNISRIRQFIGSGTLMAIQVEENGAFYIPLKSFETFAKKPRKPGRPSTKKATKPGKNARKPAKKRT